MKSLFSNYAAIIEHRNLSYFRDTSDQALVYRDLDRMNSEILNNFKSERENIKMISERREYVKAKLLDVDYLTNRVNQAPSEVRDSISKSLKALYLTLLHQA
ncbi:hypothetical protein [Peijinzhouia sedimentorum]